MTTEYHPTLEDVFHLKQALHRRAARHPLRWTILFGGVAIALGGTMMASTASPVWWLLALAGATFAAAAWAAARVNAPTFANVEQEFAGRAWLREPFRVEVDSAGLRYAHGPFRSRANWSAFAGLAETEHHLILLEHAAPGALAYGLSKRELDKTTGGTAAWRQFLTTSLQTSQGNVAV